MSHAQKQPTGTANNFSRIVIKWGVYLLLTAFLCALTVFVIFRVNANRCFSEGDYAAACALYEKNRLFGEARLEKAQLALGQKYYEEGKYKEARDHYASIGPKRENLRLEASEAYAEQLYQDGRYNEAAKEYADLGAAGREGWIACVLAIGDEKLKKGDYDGAIASYESIGDRELTRKQIGTCQYEKTVKLIRDGDYSAASKVASEISMNSGVDVAALKNTVRCAEAYSYLLDGKFDTATEKFSACMSFDPALQALEVVECIQAGRYADACALFPAVAGDSEVQITSEQWRTLLNAYAEQNITDPIDLLFTKGRIEETPRVPKETFTDSMLDEGLTTALEKWSLSLPYDYKTFIKRCGVDRKGKVLVLIRNKVFTDEYFILQEVMEQLPDAYRPFNLAEVSYIVLLTSGTNLVGTYSPSGAQALRLYQSVSLLKAPGGGVHKDFGTVRGGPPPQVAYLSEWDLFETGSDPEPEKVRELVMSALETAMKLASK